jgi:flavin reductase (DIM6/NTAB) family NADH-FMN oxidoreductase RutF
MSMSDASDDNAPDSDTAFDSGHFRTILGHFPTGVTVITGMAGDHPVGFTIGSFTSVSLDPPLVGFLPQTGSVTMDDIEASGSFCVNVLSDQQRDLCWKFAKSGTESTRFEGVDWHAAPSGSPILDRAVAWIDCSIEEIHTMGDHLFVLGRVAALDADADHDGQPPEPLLFFKGTLGTFSADG